MRGIEFQPDFTAGSCCVGDPEFRVDFNCQHRMWDPMRYSRCGAGYLVRGRELHLGPPLARMEHELRAGFNGGPGTSHGVRNSMRDPMLQYRIQAGSRDLVGMWAPNEG